MKSHSFLAGGGEMGARIRALDWSRTPLGPVEGWPQSLRTALSIMLGSRYPMFVWWGASLVNFYNDGYIPVLGKRHPRALGVNARELWAEIWNVVGPQADGVMKTGEATWNDRQLLVMERNGFVEETYFSWSYSPARDESGAVAGVFCACTEDTRRVLAERRMHTLREVAADAHGAESARAACEAAVRAMAKNRHDLPFALLYVADGPGRVRLASAVGYGNAPETLDMEALLTQGTWPLPAGGVSAPGAPWPDPVTQALAVPIAQAGSPDAAGMLVAGVSPRLALDDDYRNFVDILAGQVARAIADATTLEAERRRAEALAEIDRAKTVFFSNVSHEFRTPLTLILGPVADGLADAGEPLPPKQRERQQMVLNSALRLQKLVNGLLDFSRIEAGRARASYMPTDLGRFTANLASSFRAAMEKAGLAFVVDCPPLAEAAYVDREMWEKIVLNLVSNAFKFTFDGEIRVTLRMEDEFVLQVRDTGGGIPAADLPHIFERFRRVEGAKSRTHEGTGIGLALVEELVKLHGGSVSVQSVEGAGSTFTVSIPRGQSHLPLERIGAQVDLASTAASYAQEALGWVAEPPAPAPETGAAAGARIILADDNADMRAYLTGLLTPRYQVEALGDGEAALAAARRQPPDLVLSDVMMPSLDGFALVRALRADPALRRVPVILLSARAGEEARIEGLDSGADDYLQKPFGARELLARIAARLELARMQRELEHLFAQTPLPIAVFRGENLVFDMANAAYREVTGGRDVVGRPLLEALPELRGQGLDALLVEVMRTGKPHVGGEVPLKVMRDGGLEDTRWIFIYAPLRGAGGEIDRVIAICNDVTEQARARESERRRDEVIAVVSQELRNPLAALAAAVQLLRLSRGPVEPDMLERMERELQQMVRISDDLLAMAQLLRGSRSLVQDASEGAPAKVL